MQFSRSLQRWEFRGREKRFFMYGMQEGEIAHCANTGSLKGVLERCAAVWVHDHGTEGTRKLRYGAELAELKDGTLVGINTQRGNALAVEAIQSGLLPELGTWDAIKVEAKWDAATRFDLKIGDWWGEVKNTTLAELECGMFPDSVTTRGLKHLTVLRGIAGDGGKAIQIYIVPRSDVRTFKPADLIDPAYGKGLRAAIQAGVKVVALGATVTPEGITMDKRLEIMI